uniref:Uncharacterized protein n=1 Tax=Mycena chlorophos TaxID=658473 RepID=A0ABQ0M619_MYCCL|nr:predicted protein [Mycena chlorophos]
MVRRGAYRRVPRQHRRNLRFWAEGNRQKVLDPYIPYYAAAMDRGLDAENELLREITCVFNARIDWRVGDDVDPPLRPWDPNTPLVPELLSPAEELAKATRLKILWHRIRRWFRYRVQRTHSLRRTFGCDPRKDPFAAFVLRLSGYTRPKKRRQGYQQYMRECWEVLLPVIERKWAAYKLEHAELAGKGHKAGFRAAVVRPLFQRLDERVRQAFEARAKEQCDKDNAEYDAALRRAPDMSPEGRLRALKNVPDFAGQVLQEIFNTTGCHVTLLYGGPDPEQKGDIIVRHISIGRNLLAPQKHWGSWAPSRFKKNVSGFFAEYLQTAYTEDDCRRAALPGSEHQPEARARVRVIGNAQRNEIYGDVASDSGSSSDESDEETQAPEKLVEFDDEEDDVDRGLLDLSPRRPTEPKSAMPPPAVVPARPFTGGNPPAFPLPTRTQINPPLPAFPASIPTLSSYSAVPPPHRGPHASIYGAPSSSSLPNDSGGWPDEDDMGSYLENSVDDWRMPDLQSSLAFGSASLLPDSTPSSGYHQPHVADIAVGIQNTIMRHPPATPSRFSTLSEALTPSRTSRAQGSSYHSNALYRMSPIQTATANTSASRTMPPPPATPGFRPAPPVTSRPPSTTSRQAVPVTSRPPSTTSRQAAPVTSRPPLTTASQTPATSRRRGLSTTPGTYKGRAIPGSLRMNFRVGSATAEREPLFLPEMASPLPSVSPFLRSFASRANLFLQTPDSGLTSVQVSRHADQDYTTSTSGTTLIDPYPVPPTAMRPPQPAILRPSTASSEVFGSSSTVAHLATMGNLFGPPHQPMASSPSLFHAAPPTLPAPQATRPIAISHETDWSCEWQWNSQPSMGRGSPSSGDASSLPPPWPSTESSRTSAQTSSAPRSRPLTPTRSTELEPSLLPSLAQNGSIIPRAESHSSPGSGFALLSSQGSTPSPSFFSLPGASAGGVGAVSSPNTTDPAATTSALPARPATAATSSSVHGNKPSFTRRSTPSFFSLPDASAGATGAVSLPPTTNPAATTTALPARRATGATSSSSVHGNKQLESSTRRSSRFAGPTVSGTRLPCPSGAPDWFSSRYRLFTSVDLGLQFDALVSAWTAIETASRFDVCKDKLDTALCPSYIVAAVRDVVACPLTKAQLNKLPSAYAKWWDYLQPDWRKQDALGHWKNGGSCSARTKQAWGQLFTWGPDGFDTIVGALFIWGSALSDSTSGPWESAVVDATWMLENIAKFYSGNQWKW